MSGRILRTAQQPEVDLSTCDREPIHILGHVQSYGCLISTTDDLMVNHMSANVATLLGIDPEAAIGLGLRQVLPADTVHEMNGVLQVTSGDVGVGRLFGVDVLKNGLLFDVAMHQSDKSYIFEFEPAAKGDGRNDLATVQPLLARVKRATTIQQAAEEGALAMQILSGFDRVMVYQFAEDGTGEVIAERAQPMMEPFLGLRYPASDIPQQARALYKRNLLRMIADVDGPVSPILPDAGPHGTPLDLSLSMTRAVSPIHLEYLRNMGVAASMSVSILKDGELWGLFACHHNSPNYLDYARRSAIELFAQFFSYELIVKGEQEARQEERDARLLHDKLMMRLSSGNTLIDCFDLVAGELTSIIPFDGISIWTDGRYVSRGLAPTQSEFEAIGRFLNTAPTGEVFATNHLADGFAEAQTVADRVAGLLAIPISRTPRDFIVLYRQETARNVTWAGDPTKPVVTGPNGDRLTPRKSFAAWQEQVRGTCDPWTEAQQRAAEALRQSLIEIVLKLSDEANLVRTKAAETQELLIAELNHRARNILNLISSLVTQSKTGATDIASYTQVLDSRIQALAMAHDQLTRAEWAPTSFRELINVEINAFLSTGRDRLTVTGAAPMVAPAAFSTVALVMHEIVTNSVKYGALSDGGGKVTIDLALADNGDLHISWRDTGGPAVKAPTRRGFGSTIIEKTIPYELGGTVQTRFAQSGFEADITIPARFVTPGTLDLSDAIAPSPVADSPLPELTSVLVVEDNMLIAMDVDGMLRANGAKQTYVANTVEAALQLVAAKPVSFAVLDVNLGDQTSLPVAVALAERGIAFVLASGYGDADTVTASYPPAPIVGKPLTAESLMSGIARAYAMQRDGS